MIRTSHHCPSPFVSLFNALLCGLVAACGGAESAPEPETPAGGSGFTGGGNNSGGTSAGAGGQTESTGGSGGSPSGGASAEQDQYGYGIADDRRFPPLLHRVSQVACPDTGSAGCVTDDDCGPGQACVCGSVATQCVPAECSTDEDCDGLCLLSRGPDPNCCGSGSVAGLFCEREGSTCAAENNCAGNGRACVYIPESDRFECALTSCTDC
jgi:hypothetical protein